MSRPQKRKADVELAPPANSSGTATSTDGGKDLKEIKTADPKDATKVVAVEKQPDALQEAQRWFALAIAEHNQRRQALEAERQAWESERQWMVSNIRQIPEEDEVRIHSILAGFAMC